MRRAAATVKGGDSTAHEKAECALRDHPGLGRWVRQLPSGRLALDTSKVKQETRLDGKYLLVTSDLSLTAEAVALATRTC
jgi:hypothetical protein